MASWWVVSYHLRGIIGDYFLRPGSRLATALEGGNYGVDLFFVLSGFVLAYSYYDAFPVLTWGTYLRFLWQRLTRIYPVHILAIVALAGFLAANRLLGHRQAVLGDFSGRALITQLFLVQAWRIPDVFSWNYPAWSISMEWLAYLGFPFLIRYLVRFRSGGSLVLPVVALCALGLGAPLFMELPAEHIIRILSEFTVGCLLYILYARGVGRNALGNWGAIVSLLLALALGGIVRHFVLPLFIVLIYSLLFDRGIATTVFGSRICLYWGRVSYSLYMLHAVALSACHFLLPVGRFVNSTSPIKSLVLGAYVTAIGVSGVLAYHFVEEPCRLRMRRWFPRPSEVVPLTPPISKPTSCS